MSCAWIILKPSPCSWSMEKMSSTKLPWCQKGWQPLPVIIYICTFLQTSPPQLCEVLHSVVEHCPQYLRSPFLREGLWGDILKLSEILIKGLISHMHAQLLSHVWLFATPWPAKLLCPWNFPGKNSGVGCHFLFQGIFLTQGSNPGIGEVRTQSLRTLCWGNLLRVGVTKTQGWNFSSDLFAALTPVPRKGVGQQ